MDWSVFHWLSDSTKGVDGGEDAAGIFNTWGIVVLLVIGGGLWLIARPTLAPSSLKVEAAASGSW